ncbi:MAG: DUF4143 domain-containing protein [Candidatus Methanoplasma sp.]|jgi:hypothetical protein|nr:DUF4143 domain-containing protein [Candidatus Methanoplasma sp.]
MGGKVYHYKDSSNLDIDFVIQLRDGRWGAAEAKMVTYEFDKAADSLLRLKSKMMKVGIRDPSFLMILNITRGIAVRRDDGIIEVPIDCLGP